MLARLFGLFLLTLVAVASAEPAEAPLAAVLPDAADWKGLACAALVIVYIARRRARWRME